MGTCLLLQPFFEEHPCVAFQLPSHRFHDLFPRILSLRRWRSRSYFPSKGHERVFIHKPQFFYSVHCKTISHPLIYGKCESLRVMNTFPGCKSLYSEIRERPPYMSLWGSGAQTPNIRSKQRTEEALWSSVKTAVPPWLYLEVFHFM